MLVSSPLELLTFLVLISQCIRACLLLSMVHAAGTACATRGVWALVIGWQLYSWRIFFWSGVEVHIPSAWLIHFYLFEFRASISVILQVSQLAQLKDVVQIAEDSSMRTEGHNH